MHRLASVLFLAALSRCEGVGLSACVTARYVQFEAWVKASAAHVTFQDFLAQISPQPGVPDAPAATVAPAAAAAADDVVTLLQQLQLGDDGSELVPRLLAASGCEHATLDDLRARGNADDVMKVVMYLQRLQREDGSALIPMALVHVDADGAVTPAVGLGTVPHIPPDALLQGMLCVMTYAAGGGWACMLLLSCCAAMNRDAASHAAGTVGPESVPRSGAFARIVCSSGAAPSAPQEEANDGFAASLVDTGSRGGELEPCLWQLGHVEVCTRLDNACRSSCHAALLYPRCGLFSAVQSDHELNGALQSFVGSHLLPLALRYTAMNALHRHVVTEFTSYCFAGNLPRLVSDREVEFMACGAEDGEFRVRITAVMQALSWEAFLAKYPRQYQVSRCCDSRHHVLCALAGRGSYLLVAMLLQDVLCVTLRSRDELRAGPRVVHMLRAESDAAVGCCVGSGSGSLATKRAAASQDSTATPSATKRFHASPQDMASILDVLAALLMVTPRAGCGAAGTGSTATIGDSALVHEEEVTATSVHLQLPPPFPDPLPGNSSPFSLDDGDGRSVSYSSESASPSPRASPLSCTAGGGPLLPEDCFAVGVRADSARLPTQPVPRVIASKPLATETLFEQRACCLAECLLCCG